LKCKKENVVVISHAETSFVAFLQYGKKPNVKAIRVNNFALDQIIGFLHYFAGKE